MRIWSALCDRVTSVPIWRYKYTFILTLYKKNLSVTYYTSKGFLSLVHPHKVITSVTGKVYKTVII